MKGCLIGIVIFIAFMFLLGTCAENTNTNESLTTNDVFWHSKDLIKRQFKSPKTVEFPSLGDYGHEVIYKGDDIYEINSYVDAQNSFGAFLRTKYKATVKCTKEETILLNFITL